VNVGALTALGYSRDLVHIDSGLRRAFVPTLLAACAAVLGALGGARLADMFAAHAPRYADMVALAFAVMLGLAAYAIAIVVLRSRLPLARLARAA